MSASSLDLTLDGAPRAVPAGHTVRALVQEVTGEVLDAAGSPTSGRRLGVAVAVDAEVIPRSAWATTALRAGSAVEIVTAAQGG